MKVGDKTTRNVRIASPDDTIQKRARAARSMAECDAGALPVGQDGRLVGMVRDRDIAVRGVAQGKGPDTPVREVMTPEVRYVFEDEGLGDAADSMGEQQVRRRRARLRAVQTHVPHPAQIHRVTVRPLSAVRSKARGSTAIVKRHASAATTIAEEKALPVSR
jgi:CBS domain-containing protein